ncbi:MAG: hypothetical protein M0022_02110 [Desulfobacteraceae bacterium]|nr:hypothetical protein [Desulfobacteraceae bacterium]
MNWIYVSIMGAFALGILMGMSLGRRKAIDEIAHRQMQMDATKMWTDAFKGYMGGEK